MTPARLPEGVDPAQEVPADRPLWLPTGDEPLDLETTLRSGQVFRWARMGDAWYGPYRAGSLALRPAPGGVEVRARGATVAVGEVWRFLGLEVRLPEALAVLASDPPVREAAARFPGLRVLRQDPWDCLAAFVCSQLSNIPKIERSLERLSRAFGAPVEWPHGPTVHPLPTAERLAMLTPADLAFTGLGYRCRYLVETARALCREGPDLPALRGRPYDEALAALLRLPGVGRKVADCVLLFALDQPSAFPVDVWVRRVLHELYPREIERVLPDRGLREAGGLGVREYEALRRFAVERWGKHAGLAQQYLFHARRTRGRTGNRPASPGIE